MEPLVRVKTNGKHQVVAGLVYRAVARRLVSARQQSCASGLFAREMFSRPAAVGAIWPSSGRLARSVASRVPRLGDGLVLELGGGTGAVTHALLERGIAPERLAVVEFSPIFVRFLRTRFPGVTILQGDAAELGKLLPRGSRIQLALAIIAGAESHGHRGAVGHVGRKRRHCGPVHLRLARHRTTVPTRLSASRVRHCLDEFTAGPRTGVGVPRHRIEVS